MRPSLSSELLQIQMLQDLLLIELNDFNQETVYIVKDEDDKIVRKGKFTGHQIQINFIHLPSGHYRLGLNHREEVINYYFEKKNGDYIFSGMYLNDSWKKSIA